jgi:hypothetical protein
MIANNKYVWIGGGIALCVALYLAKRGADAVGEGLNAINPMDPDNIINRGATDLYQWATGSTGTIGGDIYDVTHDGTFNPASNNNLINRGVTSVYQGVTGSTGTIGGDIYDATHGGRLDPTSSNNAAAASVDWIGEAISGTKNWTLGGAIYDWTH